MADHEREDVQENTGIKEKLLAWQHTMWENIPAKQFPILCWAGTEIGTGMLAVVLFAVLPGLGPQSVFKLDGWIICIGVSTRILVAAGGFHGAYTRNTDVCRRYFYALTYQILVLVFVLIVLEGLRCSCAGKLRKGEMIRERGNYWQCNALRDFGKLAGEPFINFIPRREDVHQAHVDKTILALQREHDQEENEKKAKADKTERDQKKHEKRDKKKEYQCVPVIKRSYNAERARKCAKKSDKECTEKYTQECHLKQKNKDFRGVLDGDTEGRDVAGLQNLWGESASSLVSKRHTARVTTRSKSSTAGMRLSTDAKQKLSVLYSKENTSSCTNVTIGDALTAVFSGSCSDGTPLPFHFDSLFEWHDSSDELDGIKTDDSLDEWESLPDDLESDDSLAEQDSLLEEGTEKKQIDEEGTQEKQIDEIRVLSANRSPKEKKPPRNVQDSEDLTEKDLLKLPDQFKIDLYEVGKAHAACLAATKTKPVCVAKPANCTKEGGEPCPEIKFGASDCRIWEGTNDAPPSPHPWCFISKTEQPCHRVPEDQLIEDNLKDHEYFYNNPNRSQGNTDLSDPIFPSTVACARRDGQEKMRRKSARSRCKSFVQFMRFFLYVCIVCTLFMYPFLYKFISRSCADSTDIVDEFAFDEEIEYMSEVDDFDVGGDSAEEEPDKPDKARKKTNKKNQKKRSSS